MAKSEWAGYATLRYVLRVSMYVPDDQWLDEVIADVKSNVEAHGGQTDEPQWDTSYEDGWQVIESSIASVMTWMGCDGPFINSVIKRFGDKHEEQAEAHYQESLRRELDGPRGPRGPVLS